ncbi:MAG: flagellar biosynthetic protein FliR, partial [Cyanobacteria bacterium REEB65]|nr:flagellar biosynthetic protein FliR [Cyanobacteria bacterium REEB65]
ALAIMNRVMPQMNVFVAGFPLKIAIGFGSITIGMPLLVAYFDGLFAKMAHQIMTFFG